MISNISSDLPSFKSFQLNPGLNILMVEKSPESTEQYTRNRAGKTSFVEIIHFLLGSNCSPSSLFRNEAIKDYEFSMTFDLANNPITVSRKGNEPSKIRILDGRTESWPITPYYDKSIGKTIISNENWKIVLGNLFYNIPLNIIEREKYPPKFRALFSYSARRENNHAFSDPITQSRYQRIFDWQLSISYLLGINWNLSREWQLIRDREKTLVELKKAIKQGAFGEVLEKSAFIRTRLTIFESRTKELQEEINSFKVLNEYKELEREASELTEKINLLVNQNVIDRELVNDLKESLTLEEPPSLMSLEELYKEAGVSLPELTLKRFDEIKEFHKAIIENREGYLNGEIQEAQYRNGQREKAIHKFSLRRAEIMSILSKHGALEQYNALRSELSKAEAEIESLKNRLSATEQLEQQKTELEFERKDLYIRLNQNLNEQKSAIDRAIIIFEEISKSLYEEAGSFVVDSGLNGPKFEVQIQGEKSKGIRNMQIFCFDLMLTQLSIERGIGPKFLIHDSHLFDGVDERQVSKAIQIGAKKAEQNGFQYLITMNSDAIPSSLPEDFDIDKYILEPRLTDAKEDGGLFGFRFE